MVANKTRKSNGIEAIRGEDVEWCYEFDEVKKFAFHLMSFLVKILRLEMSLG